jgi:Zn-dependent peptidase ImmA (M78 family)
MTALDFGEVEHRALACRAEAGLHAEDPVPDIVEVVERIGIPVAVWPFGADGPDGLYVSDGIDRLIVLNSGKYLPRFRFTAAHELGHATYQDGPRLDVDILAGTSREEKRGNAFAGNFLVPGRALRARCQNPTTIDPEDVLVLASEFGVSYPTLVYRLHNTGLIGASNRDRLLDASSAVVMEKLRGQPGNEVRLPADFAKNARIAYEKYDISFQRFSELLRRDKVELAASLAGSGFLHVEDKPR